MSADELIKELAKFSSDALYNAIEAKIKDKERFISSLKELKDSIKKSPKKSEKKTTLFSRKDDDVFLQQIIPQIRHKLVEYERKILNEGYSINFNFDFITNYEDLDIEGLKKCHAIILQQENNVKAYDLVVKFHKGCLYSEAKKLNNNKDSLEIFFKREFGISRQAADRYIHFMDVIKRLPRLVICDLSYTQITKHEERLFSFLKSETEGLYDRLSSPLDLEVEKKSVKIKPEDNDMKVEKLNFDPDYEYRDSIENDEGIEPLQKKMKKMKVQ